MEDKIKVLGNTIKEIKMQIETLKIEGYSQVIPLLNADTRVAVKKLGASLDRKLKAIEKEEDRILKMKSMEIEYYNQGYKFIGGIDEVGRGPLAGPVVTCVVILNPKSKLLYVNDSKKLSKKLREELCHALIEEALDYEIGVCDCDVIDDINILNATKKAMADSVRALRIKPDLLLLDAIKINSDIKQVSVIHGDALCYTIGAASIIAKVYRDHLMKAYHEIYPEYGFDHNMGYGTATHLEAIKKHGLTPIHRKSFVRNLGF